MQRQKAGLKAMWAAVAIGAALAGMAGAAQAATPDVTITSTPGPDLAPQAPAGTTLALTVDFDHLLPADVSLTGDYMILNGSINNVAAAPAGDTTKYLAVPSGSAELNFASEFNSGSKLDDVSFYYGSIDSYNTITLLDAKGVAFDTFTGSFFPPANGDQQSPQSNRMVNIALGAGQTLGGITLASSQPALEVDNFRFYTSAAPEPGTWALMIVGFGLVGAILRNARSMLGRQVAA